MEQGGFGGRYETMSSGESCQTSGPRLAHVRFRLSPGIGLCGYHVRISQ